MAIKEAMIANFVVPKQGLYCLSCIVQQTGVGLNWSRYIVSDHSMIRTCPIPPTSPQNFMPVLKTSNSSLSTVKGIVEYDMKSLESCHLEQS